MIKKLIFPVLSIFLLCSCYITRLAQVDDNVKKLDIGMAKREVINIMGNDYNIANANINVVELEYRTLDNFVYILSFMDDRLASIEKTQYHVLYPPIQQKESCHPHNKHTGEHQND